MLCGEWNVDVDVESVPAGCVLCRLRWCDEPLRVGQARLWGRVWDVCCAADVWHMRAMRTDGGGSCAGSSVKRPIILGYGCAVVR